MIDVDILMYGLPWTTPFGSKRVNRKASMYSSSGTPCCSPRLTAMAKQLVMLRNAAPSLCMSMKISPRVPSSYSPVRMYILWLPIRAFWVYPARRSGSRRRRAMYRWTIFSVIFSAARTSGAFGSSGFGSGSAVTAASSAASDESATELSGWLSFDPSRYRALALVINCHDSQYAFFTSSTVASLGMLIVLEIAPLMNGWATAIMRMCDSHARNRLPNLPHLLAQSKTG